MNHQDLLLWLERKAAAPAPAMPSQLESMLLEHGSGTMRVETSHPNAKLPEQRATGGYDLWPTERLEIPANGRATVGTGVCIQYVSGVVGLVIAKKNQMWGWTLSPAS